MAPSACAYHTFATTFEALEAPYFHRVTVFEYPGHRHTNKQATIVPEKFVAEEHVNFCKDMSVNEGANANNEQYMHQPYQLLIKRRVSLTPSNMGPSPITHHPHWRRERTPSLPPPTSKLRSCNGTSALVTWASPCSSSLPSMVKSQRSSPKLRHPSVLAASLARWLGFLGVVKRPRLPMKSSLLPSQGNASLLTKWCQLKWDFMRNWKSGTSVSQWTLPCSHMLCATLCNTMLLHNCLPVLDDGTSKLELFNSIFAGSNMRNVHIFGCPVFALQIALALGNQLLSLSPCTRPGLNLGPNPIHAKDVYLVLNLITGWVSHRYNCYFDDFFETVRHGRPDISGTFYWQHLANLDCASAILAKVSTLTQYSIMSYDNPSEDTHTMIKSIYLPPTYDVTLDDYSILDGKSLVTENTHHSCQSQALHQAEGITTVEPTITAGTSQRGQVHTMSQRMDNSVSQQDFFWGLSMYYMAL